MTGPAGVLAALLLLGPPAARAEPRDPVDVRAAVSASLEQLATRQADRVLGRRLRDEARKELLALGREATPALIEHLDSESFTVRWEAVNALGQARDPRARRALSERILRDGDLHVRWRATWALAGLGSAEASALLREHFDDADPDVSWRAVVAASVVAPGPELLARLLDGADHRDAWRRWEAVDALGRVGDASATTVLSRRLEDSDERVRREAVLSLGAIDSPAARSALFGALKAEEPELRWRAAMVLGRPRDDTERARLRQVLASESDDRTREWLLKSLPPTE